MNKLLTRVETDRIYWMLFQEGGGGRLSRPSQILTDELRKDKNNNKKIDNEFSNLGCVSVPNYYRLQLLIAFLLYNSLL